MFDVSLEDLEKYLSDSLTEDLEEHLSDAVDEYQDWLLALAPRYLFEAVRRLHLDAMLRTMQEHEFIVVSPDRDKEMVTSLGKMMGKTAIRKLRDECHADWQARLRAIIGTKPGRPDDPPPEEIPIYHEEILAVIRKAKAEISNDGASLEWLREDDSFLELQKHSDLMERLFSKGPKGQPNFIACAYTIREYRLNLSESGLASALRRVRGPKARPRN